MGGDAVLLIHALPRKRGGGSTDDEMELGFSDAMEGGVDGVVWSG